MESIFENLNRQEKTLPERVAEQIIQLIVDEKLSSSEKLPNEFELAAQLNVGRGTIREAVKLLVSRNVLEIKRGRGTFICAQPGQIQDPFGFAYISDKTQLAKDLMDVRIQVEPWCAQLAAENATDAERQKILQCLSRMRDDFCIYKDKTEKDAFLNSDMDFHKSIADATHNIIAPKLIPVIGAYVLIAGRIGAAEDTLSQHQAIVDAILAGDGKAAARAMKYHLNNTRELLNRFPEKSIMEEG